MASNTMDFDSLQELANFIREPNQRLLEEFKHGEKKRLLNQKLAQKADKAIIADSKRNRKAAMKRPGGFTGRVARRAGGAVMGGIGGAIGGIPIVGAIFRAIGQEAANTLRDKKNYTKELARQRKTELKLIEQYEAARKKKEQDELDAANPKPGRRSGTGGSGSGGLTSATVVKLTNAAQALESAAISITPAVRTFEEVADRFSDAVEGLNHRSANKVTDPQALEYLHAIEYFTQETAASVEKIVASIDGMAVGRSAMANKKVLEHLNALEFLTQESAARLENIDTDRPKIVADIEATRNGVWKLNASSNRIEKLLRAAAADRINQMDMQQEQLKYEKKSYETQEDTKFIGILNLLSNLLGGLGGMLKGAAIGLGGMMAGKLGKGLMKGGVWGAAAMGAWEIGTAIGDSLYEYLSKNKGFMDFSERLFTMIDRVLAFFGDEDAKARIAAIDGLKYLQLAQENLDKAGLQMTPEIQDYVLKNNTLPGMTQAELENQGYVGGAMGITVGKRTDEEQAQLVRNAWMDTARPMQPGEDLIPNSVALEEAKAKAALQQSQQGIVNAPSTTNNNSNTVLPPPLSADPAGAVSKSRNLGD